MVNETTIKCFLCLAETLNFTACGKKMFISQQAVSKHIAQLEKDFGFRLFKRTHHYVALTEAGRHCYEMFSSFRPVYEQTIAEHRRQSAALARTLRAGYLELLNLPPRLRQSIELFRNQFPGVRYAAEQYDRVELNEKLLSGHLDLVITYASFAPSVQGLKQTALLETPLLLLSAQNHPLASEHADYQTFEKEPLLFESPSKESPAEIHLLMAEYIKKSRLSPRETKIVPNRQTAYTAVELGEGILLCTELSRPSNHHAINKYPTGLYETLVCLYREDDKNPLVKKYVEFLPDLSTGSSLQP